jgi:hypothetical protein
MTKIEVGQWILIGAIGGGTAGVAVSLFEVVRGRASDFLDKRTVYRWLAKSTAVEAGHEFRTTREIASWTNLTIDRTRYICSIHPKIMLYTGINIGEDDMWSIFERGDRSVYEKRGPVVI